MAPRAISETLFPQTAGAQVLADFNPMGTCKHAYGVSTIDFFIASNDLASAAQPATVFHHPAIPDHRPVRLVLPANTGDMKKQVIRSVQQLPNDPVFGPRPPPPDWAPARNAAFHAIGMASASTSIRAIRHGLACAYRILAETIEEEVAGFTDTVLTGQHKRRGQKIKAKIGPACWQTDSAR